MLAREVRDQADNLRLIPVTTAISSEPAAGAA